MMRRVSVHIQDEKFDLFLLLNLFRLSTYRLMRCLPWEAHYPLLFIFSGNSKTESHSRYFCRALNNKVLALFV